MVKPDPGPPFTSTRWSLSYIIPQRNVQRTVDEACDDPFNVATCYAAPNTSSEPVPHQFRTSSPPCAFRVSQSASRLVLDIVARIA